MGVKLSIPGNSSCMYMYLLGESESKKHNQNFDDHHVCINNYWDAPYIMIEKFSQSVQSIVNFLS